MSGGDTLAYATPAPRGAPPARARLIPGRQQVPLLATAVVCALLYVAAGLKYDGFFSAGVFLDFFTNNAYLGCAALGLTLVILAGGIDLSVGSMVACSGVLIAKLVEERGVSPAVAFGLVLAAGAAFGAGQGLLIHAYNLTPFLVTLGGLFTLRGLGLLVKEGQIAITNERVSDLAVMALPIGPGLQLVLWPATLFLAGVAVVFSALGSRSVTAYVVAAAWGVPAALLAMLMRHYDVFVPPVPLITIVFAALAVVLLWVARSSSFGRNVYAVGGSEPSALLMGLPVGRTKIGVYAACGFCAALAGVVRVIYTTSGDPVAAQGMELDAIATVVVGGTLLSGGVGNLIGTPLGVLVFAIIQTIISFDGRFSSAWTRISTGVLLLAFIVLQKLIQPKRAAGRS